MNTIKNITTNTIEINKSEFITYLYPVNDTDSIKDILKELKTKYKDATHHVSAYIIGNNAEVAHLNDDHEPQGTAAGPIMDVLKRNNLTNILCVVIRYFGGIKLGAGGLIRAYSQACSKCLEIAEIIEIKKYNNLKLTFAYTYYELIQKLLIDARTIDSNFTDKVSISIEIEESLVESLKTKLVNLTSNQIEIEEL